MDYSSRASEGPAWEAQLKRAAGASLFAWGRLCAPVRKEENHHTVSQRDPTGPSPNFQVRVSTQQPSRGRGGSQTQVALCFLHYASHQVLWVPPCYQLLHHNRGRQQSLLRPDPLPHRAPGHSVGVTLSLLSGDHFRKGPETQLLQSGYVPKSAAGLTFLIFKRAPQLLWTL